MFWTAVPKAAINEYSDPGPLEHKIRAPGKPGLGLQAVPEAYSPKGLS